MIRRYSVLAGLETLEERFAYLKLSGSVGRETFGHDRWLNQQFYMSPEWVEVRRYVQIRDNGCDLGVPGYEIYNRPVVHHMNPMRPQDLIESDPRNSDPEFLILTTHRTHNAIHYGDEKQLPRPFVERTPGDTKLW